MSTPEHVEENLKLVDVEPLRPEEFMTLFSEV
jgi:aryl-alcohol dehydrogenase-like predicted oxidoreductase